MWRNYYYYIITFCGFSLWVIYDDVYVYVIAVVLGWVLYKGEKSDECTHIFIRAARGKNGNKDDRYVVVIVVRIIIIIKRDSQMIPPSGSRFVDQLLFSFYLRRYDERSRNYQSCCCFVHCCCFCSCSS